ncbi:hypothetical protein [Brevundimonas sp.]|uniref:hypothetical protein n=1 Tax=Brevundimonas sp. TaxID=1871086 RepID=UPI002D594D97|nr:hypothetical protein [Brevundimonas sp.]HYC67900.1 hypothetical protein [Brevundimonas sp.]
MIGMVMAAALSAAPACVPPPGTEALLATPQRVIVIGEMHGTAETPAAFAEIVCAAAERGPVTVALELPQGMQPSLDAFLAAPDAAAALAALEGSPFLDPAMNDGRSSEAMLAMLNSVRELKLAGRDVAFHAFQPSQSRPRGLDQSWYELDMGHILAMAVFARADARVLALVGNLHARKTAIDRFPDLGLPAAAHLPAADTLTLNVAQQGGEAWNCQRECGPNASISTYDGEARGVVLEPAGDGAYDGVLALGPTTASPPVRPAADDQPSPTSSGSSS